MGVRPETAAVPAGVAIGAASHGDAGRCAPTRSPHAHMRVSIGNQRREGCPGVTLTQGLGRRGRLPSERRRFGPDLAGAGPTGGSGAGRPGV